MSDIKPEAAPGRDPAAPGREAEDAAGYDLVTLSGRGDKDLADVLARAGGGDSDGG